MPRLDAERVALWRTFCVTATELQRRVEDQLMAEHDLSLAWFEVLSALRTAGGTLRVFDLRERLNELPSSLSRRLDRMEQEGFVQRASTPTPADRRAVTVSSTPFGRAVWRDANVTFRRAVQQQFAHRLTDTDLVALHRVLGKAGS